MRPSERRDVRQELRRRAESVALALHDSMAEVKRVPANDDGGKEVQAGYAEMLVLQCHLALSRNRPEPPRHDALAASSSRLETVTVTCMDEPHEELLAIADAMDRLVERGRQPDVREPLGRLEDAAKEIRKSSSGSWLGYHANVYYKGLRPRPPGAHFSQDSGLGDRYVSHTTGEWSELDPEAVEAAIREHAGNPNMEASARLREEAVGEFETQKLKRSVRLCVRGLIGQLPDTPRGRFGEPADPHQLRLDQRLAAERKIRVQRHARDRPEDLDATACHCSRAGCGGSPGARRCGPTREAR